MNVDLHRISYHFFRTGTLQPAHCTTPLLLRVKKILKLSSTSMFSHATKGSPCLQAAQLRRVAMRLKSKRSVPLYLNPHMWDGLPADRIFELHEMRRTTMGEKYVPDDAERYAILATFQALKSKGPKLSYVYEYDNFKERVMNNTPPLLQGLPPKLSNVEVINRGATPHEKRHVEQLHRVSAYEMPLLAKFRQPYVPSTNTPLQFTFHTDFSDESTATNRKVTLAVQLEELQLEPAQAKKFMLLLGNKFDHNKRLFRLSTDRFPEATQNARWLAETFEKLLSESKDLLKNTFDEVPVDTRHTRARKTPPVFPDAWKRPQDAPEKKFQILKECVETIVQRKDQQYIKELSP